MYPVICKIGFIEIYSYGLMVALAFLTSGFLLSRRVSILGVEKDFVWNLYFWILLGGIAGGRLLYILLNLVFFLRNPKELFMLWHGGLVWYGGFSGGFIAGIFYLRKNKVPPAATLDLIAPFIALGQAIGRIGCFLNGCCYGLPAPWGVYFPVHNEYLLPVQAFSSLGLIIIFIILRIFQERPHRKGEVFVLYLLLYSVKRFFMEYLRNDSARIHFWAAPQQGAGGLGLTIFQLISLAIFLIAACLWFVLPKKPAK